MTPEELYATTPRQFHNRLNGWRGLREAQSREQHELVRLHVLLTKADLPKGKQSIGPTDIIAFPWEAKPKGSAPSPEEIRAMLKGAKEVWGMKLSPNLEKSLETQQ
jgi:hypothetical protein